MPTVSGFTTFGIIRKRMADLYADFALRIKQGGVFGTQTTADAPDLFPSDPLVQIMATASASTHELWEAVELFYAQLDPNTASGVYLEYLHGARLGITRDPGQTDAEYRAAIQAALARPLRHDLTVVAAARPDISCAVLLTSTADAPIEGVPAPGNMLVVKGCDPDYTALAEDLYNSVELGLHQFYGDVTASYQPPGGGCVTYKVQPAQPLFAAVEVHGYYTDSCGGSNADAVRSTVLARLQAEFDTCAVGTLLSTATAMRAIGALSGFIVTDVRLARRARQLWGNDCDPTDAPMVTICGVETPWVTSITCGFNAGEVWCPLSSSCMDARPWEYLAFDEQFITVVEDTTLGGCS